MKNESYKIAIGLFLFFIAAILYLTFGLEEKVDYRISKIELKGNTHLEKADYFEFAGLQNKNEYEQLNLGIVRDRIQRHPYVQTATVEFIGNQTVEIVVNEKVFKAHILTSSKEFIMTDQVEILPIVENTRNLDYPIIRLNDDQSVERFNFPKSNLEIERSFKILSAAKMMNQNLYKNLSEIDLRNGNNIIIYFSSVDYPVILGGENEIKKMVVFEKLWESLSTVQASKLLDYVDLRFKDKVYLGLTGEQNEAGETQS